MGDISIKGKSKILFDPLKEKPVKPANLNDNKEKKEQIGAEIKPLWKKKKKLYE